MDIKLGSAITTLTRAQQFGLLASVVAAIGGAGAFAYHAATAPVRPAKAQGLSKEEQALAASVTDRKERASKLADKLKQSPLGDSYEYDSQGNLIGVADRTGGGQELPQNRTLQSAGAQTHLTPTLGRQPPTDQIAKAIQGTPDYDLPDEDPDNLRRRRSVRYEPPARADRAAGDAPDELAKPASMLGYSTDPTATWAQARPQHSAETKAANGSGQPQSPNEMLNRALDAMDRSSRVLDQTREHQDPDRAATDEVAPAPQPASFWGQGSPTVSPGPSKSGESLYPAQRGAQLVPPGGVGDMRIGTGAGPDTIVRQGKFLDCVVVNQIVADLVESPVIAMVSRDFVSQDGRLVIVPSGSKLLGEAGRVQNIQQARVYIKFDRIIYPDQRSAYFPKRKVPAVDGLGAVGMEGDVDRHLMLQFGAAVMLGLLDGFGAAVQSPSAGSNPTLRDLVMARTSGSFQNVIAGVIQKYANVVPTVTVEPGAKLKIYFAEDVLMSPYAPSSTLSWVSGGADQLEVEP